MLRFLVGVGSIPVVCTFFFLFFFFLVLSFSLIVYFDSHDNRSGDVAGRR